MLTYQLEYQSYLPNQVRVHTSALSSTRIYFSNVERISAYTGGDVPGYICSLASIHGIETVVHEGYEVILVKGRVFNWEPIIPKAIEILRDALAEDGRVLEAGFHFVEHERVVGDSRVVLVQETLSGRFPNQ